MSNSTKRSFSKSSLNQIRKTILEISHHAQSCHVGPSLSCVEILASIYSLKSANDKVILSKGHAVIALYALMTELGVIKRKEVFSQFLTNGGNLLGHPSHKHSAFVDWSTGSLGHGLAVAAGMAYYLKTEKKAGKIFVVLSDGELNIGNTWEAVMFIAHHNLNNIIPIVDINGLQAMGKTDDIIKLAPIDQKWISFGWHVSKVDGHDFIKLREQIVCRQLDKSKPTVILADTVKGKGVESLEGTYESHYKAVTKEHIDTFLGSLQ